ncbi:MAG: hypothetical protein FJZ60_00210 [Chlamydiae bacterium]|nr:hypothetical protein [Chlamydiota bacterium]
MVEEKNFINATLDFIKKFWGFFAVGLGVSTAAFFFFYFNKKNDDTYGMIKRMQNSHEEELKKIYEIREEEKKKIDDIQKKYDEKISNLEIEYKRHRLELEEKNKEAANKIVKSLGDKPKELADRFSQTTGFKVILPEE